MKKLLVSSLTKRIYLTNAKADKKNPSLFVGTGEREDFTDEAIRAVYEWFIEKVEEQDGKEYGIHYGDLPYSLKMTKKGEE